MPYEFCHLLDITVLASIILSYLIQDVPVKRPTQRYHNIKKNKRENSILSLPRKELLKFIT